MKQDKNKIKEPYHPEKAPNPPQILDPNLSKERNEKRMPEENKENKSESSGKTSGHRHKLLDSDADIDDETTI
jgi:hypothetical protein